MRITDGLLIGVAAAVCFGSLAIVCSPQREAVEEPPYVPGEGDPPDVEGPDAPRLADSRYLLTRFLPEGYVQDGSVDYGAEVQAAVDAAAGGTLVLPDFPVRVAPRPGERFAVLIGAGIELVGSPASTLVVREEGVQLLRAVDVDGLVLRDFRVAGPGGDGRGMGHGLVQVLRGSDVRIERLRVEGADADGIAVAVVEGVHVVDCAVRDASKSSVYVSSSRRVVVRGNRVSGGGGHVTPGGSVVGVGIQLSSNSEVLCSDNVVDGGLGIGILCNALSGGAAPVGNTIVGNRIRGVDNPFNVDGSSGIKLANGAADKRTRTVVSGNVIDGCGAYGIHLENHGASVVQGNQVFSSARSGIVVGTVDRVVVARNTLFDDGTEPSRGLDSIMLINDARGVVVRDNEIQRTGTLASAKAIPSDRSQTRANVLVPRVSAMRSAPTAGEWRRGDVVLSLEPAFDGPVGWVCVSAGKPGSWRGFGSR